MFIEDLLEIIEENLPADSAMDGDRIGLQVQAGRDEVSSILIALELNEEVINEAKQNNCDCIITFHPLIYSPMTFIKEDNRVGRLCSELIRNSISQISIHTNYDTFAEGTSKILAELLQLKVDDFLIPDNKYTKKGIGVIAIPDKPLTQEELLNRVFETCNSPIRYSKLKSTKLIDRIAIVGGSGSSFIDNAIDSGAEAFITADITYHRFIDVDGGIMLIDPGHYEMEQFVPKGLASLLIEKINSDKYKMIRTSMIHTNPVNYYPDKGKYIEYQKKYLQNNRMVVKKHGFTNL